MPPFFDIFTHYKEGYSKRIRWNAWNGKNSSLQNTFCIEKYFTLKNKSLTLNKTLKTSSKLCPTTVHTLMVQSTVWEILLKCSQKTQERKRNWK